MSSAAGRGCRSATDVENSAEAGDDDALSVGVGGRDGLVDEGTGLHAQVGDGLDEGSFVGAIDDDDLHVAGDLADEHAIAPLFNDEGKVELTQFAGSIPAEFAGVGVDREGGRCSAVFADGAEAGRVLVGWNCSSCTSVIR